MFSPVDIDSAVSAKVGGKNILKNKIKKILNSLIKVNNPGAFSFSENC
jgi:hypothetical protein